MRPLAVQPGLELNGIRVTLRALVVVVKAPLPYVAIHIEQTPSIGRVTADFCQFPKKGTFSPTPIGAAPNKIRLGAIQFVA